VVLTERCDEVHELRVVVHLGLEVGVLRISLATFRGEADAQRIAHVDERRHAVAHG
jgi:hypothetical protein